MSAQPPYPPPPSRPPSYRPGRRPFPIAAILAAVVVLIVVAGVAYWLGGRDDNKPSASATTPAATAAASGSGGAAPSATTGTAPSASAGVAASASAAALKPSSSVAAPSSTSSPTATSPSPATTTPPPVNPVPDFGYLHSVVSAGGVTKITFDRAVILTGPAAASYAKAHHTEVDDDYIIQNDNPLIRTWTLSPTAVVLGSIQLNNTVAQTPSTVTALQTFVAAHPKSFLPVDLYYDKNDAVIKIAERYFP